MAVVVIISMDEKKGILMRKVEGMLGDERLGFNEAFPLFTHTLELDNGFDRKPCEDVGDYLKGKKWFVDFTSHVLVGEELGIQRKEGDDEKIRKGLRLRMVNPKYQGT